MLEHAKIIISAWDHQKLVGFLRAMTDFSFDCYINDLAVDQEYQGRGIGKELVQLCKQSLAPKTYLFFYLRPLVLQDFILN
jgi:ribosomal protein S18 acetylase RimI-like enzyme